MELIGALITLILLVMLFREIRKKRYRGNSSKQYWKDQNDFIKKNDIRNVENQLRFVNGSSFSTQKLMNKPEYAVFSILENWAGTQRTGYRVFSQVSLGAYLSSGSKQAFSSVNSKRTDFLIIDPFGNPIVAIEYQGSGHYQNDALERDQVKRIAHRKAGVEYLEIYEDIDQDEIVSRVERAIQDKAMSFSQNSFDAG